MNFFIADPYLENLRQEIVGTGDQSVRSSDVSQSVDEGKHERSFIHQMRDALFLQKELDNANERI